MQRTLLPILAALSFSACGIAPADRVSWTEPEEQLFEIGPYIILDGPNKAYVAVESDADEPPVVEWWSLAEVAEIGDASAAVDASAVTRVTAARDGDLWVAELTGLPSTDEIAYRVIGKRGRTAVESFRTTARPGKSFRFAAFGDTRTDHGVHRAVVEAVARENIDFYVHTGDMVDRGGIREQWRRFFQIQRPLSARAPIVPSIGNHDMSRRSNFKEMFLLDRWTSGRRYYYHDWGNFRLVVVDGGIECRDGCEQYAYVARILAEGAAQGKLMAMALHWPPYSSGSHGSDETVQGPISELAHRYGVELVIAGHDHHYERTKPIDGTVYVVSGSAGAPVRPVRPQAFTAHARTEPHFVLFDVESDRMILRAIDVDGNTFDTWVIQPNPPQTGM